MKIEPDAGELASGSGQINPKTAVHPGLVYDIEMTSYLSLLCQQGYNDTDIALITGSKKYSCGNAPPLLGFDGLNYPSFHLQVENETSEITAVYYRTVTNVGYGKSTYKAKVKPPKGVSVEVIPNVMTFDRPSEKKDFKVVLKGKFVEKETWYVSGSLVWSDTRHNVRSPILVSLKLFDY